MCVSVVREIRRGVVDRDGRATGTFYIRTTSCGLERNGIRISVHQPAYRILLDRCGNICRIIERISDPTKPQAELKIRVEPLHRRDIRTPVVCGGSV